MYLDIALGLIVGLTVAFLSEEYSLAIVFFGVVAALAPDIDFLVYVVRRRFKVDHFAHEHRELLHSPILFSGLGAIVISFFSPVYGVVWFFGTLWHFLHDTFDGGWGIRWLHPFYKGFFILAAYSPKKHIATKDEQRAIASKYGNPDWLKEEYFVPNVKLFTEFAFLAVAILAVALWYFTA